MKREIRPSIFLGLCLLALFLGVLARPLSSHAKDGAFAESDKQLKGEVKKLCPVLIEDPSQGSLKLNRDGSFAKVGKGRFDVRGGWDIKNGKIVLTWSETDDTLKLPAQISKDGLVIDGHAKDKASGKFLLGGSSAGTPE